MSEPGWKRNGRNGPFDWWLACQTHGYEHKAGCLSCMTASDHNAEFAEKLKSEKDARPTPAAAAGVPPGDMVPAWKLREANNRMMNLRLDLRRLIDGEVTINGFEEVTALKAMLAASGAPTPIAAAPQQHPTYDECATGNVLLDLMMRNRFATTQWPENWMAVRDLLIQAQRLAASGAPAPTAQPVSFRWERRKGYGYGDGIKALCWQPWEPCTEAEAKRVTGLRSWEVRRLECFVSGAPAGAPTEGEQQPSSASSVSRLNAPGDGGMME